MTPIGTFLDTEEFWLTNLDRGEDEPEMLYPARR